MRFESRKCVKMRFAAGALPGRTLLGEFAALHQSPDPLAGFGGGKGMGKGG